MAFSTTMASPATCSGLKTFRAAPVAARRVVRMRAEKENQTQEKAEEPALEADTPKMGASQVKLDMPDGPVDSVVFGPIQELINGRTAMIGFVSAVISEKLSHQAVISQIGGKYVDGQLIEKAHGTASLYFGALVVILTMASLAPKFFSNEYPKDRAYGPFQAGTELTLGRIAMIGFPALLVTEALMGYNALF